MTLEAPPTPEDEALITRPATLPLSELTKFASLLVRSSSDFTSWTLYERAFSALLMPRAVTTVPSIIMESSSRVTLNTLRPPIGSSTVLYPRQLISIEAESMPAGSSNEKFPSRSVPAPRVVPFTRTPAPMTGLPYVSVICPETTLSSGREASSLSWALVIYTFVPWISQVIPLPRNISSRTS